MSQAKVDKYKEEKKNRAKTLKKQKVAKVIGVLVAALGVGAIIGIPLGKYIYNTKKEEEARSRTIVSSNFETWFGEYWGKNYSDVMSSTNIDDLMNQLQDASATDAESEDADVEDEGVEEPGVEEIELEDAGE